MKKTFRIPCNDSKAKIVTILSVDIDFIFLPVQMFENTF